MRSRDSNIVLKTEFKTTRNPSRSPSVVERGRENLSVQKQGNPLNRQYERKKIREKIITRL